MKENNSMEIKEEDYIIYTIKNIGEIVAFSIHYQSPKITSKVEPIGFVASNDLLIASAYETNLEKNIVWIKGSKENDDGLSILKFETSNEAKEYVDMVNEAFKELKESGYNMKWSNVKNW